MSATGDTMRLRRELGTGSAVLLGLGAMVGTGVFVSIGLAAGVAGPAVVLAVAIAAAVALGNALSSAQLAAVHPVSGGTYEYGYELLSPALGFTAGWMFLVAKSASAATAALGFAGYALHATGLAWPHVPVALAAVALLVALVLAGMRRSNAANVAIVSLTLGSLGWFVVAGLPAVSGDDFRPFLVPGAGEEAPWAALFHATALMFVAFTGYGRIATLGEEVHEPRRTIPRAIAVTMATAAVLYLGVAVVGVGVVGSAGLAAATAAEAAPLAVAGERLGRGTAPLLTLGAVTAMLGVLLNLVLGLSRVALAMGRRRDLPAAFARLDRSRSTPTVAVVAVGGVIAALVLVGDVRTTWSWSAFTVLVYYALTNLAALRLPARDRLYPRWIAAAGLVACLFLAFWVDVATWAGGLAAIAFGLVWHRIARRRADAATRR